MKTAAAGPAARRSAGPPTALGSQQTPDGVTSGAGLGLEHLLREPRTQLRRLRSEHAVGVDGRHDVPDLGDE